MDWDKGSTTSQPPVRVRRRTRPWALVSWPIGLIGLALLPAALVAESGAMALAGGAGVVLALLIDRVRYLCGGCGNRVESASVLCPACGARLAKRLPKPPRLAKAPPGYLERRRR